MGEEDGAGCLVFMAMAGPSGTAKILLANLQPRWLEKSEARVCDKQLLECERENPGKKSPKFSEPPTNLWL